MINFLRYNETGDIESAGRMASECIEWEIENGAQLLVVDLGDDFNPAHYRVDVATKEIVAKPVAPITPAPEPAPSIPPISDRQFFQQAAIAGYITQPDALSAVQTGFIPMALQQIVDDILDPTEKFGAEMLLSGATVFLRDHPLTSQIGIAFGLSSGQLDQFWRDAAKL